MEDAHVHLSESLLLVVAGAPQTPQLSRTAAETTKTLQKDWWLRSPPTSRLENDPPLNASVSLMPGTKDPRWPQMQVFHFRY